MYPDLVSVHKHPIKYGCQKHEHSVNSPLHESSPPVRAPKLWAYRRLGLLPLAAMILEFGILSENPAVAAIDSEAGVAMLNYSGSKATLLAIDDYSLPLKKDLCYYLNQPKVRSEPVVIPSGANSHATDTVAAHFLGTVLQDSGKFRMWYYGVGWKKTLKPDAKDADWTDNLRVGPVCYAESPDGIHWTKPNLEQVEHKGSRENNAVALPDAGFGTTGVLVIRDEGESDASRRYKMVYEICTASSVSARTATSPDGLVWTSRPGSTIPDQLEPISFYRHDGLYYVHAHYISLASEGGHKAGRQGYVWISNDFDHWLPAIGEAFTLPEPTDPSARGFDRPYVQVHQGVGAVDFGNVFVGLYCPWHARPNPGDWFGNGTTFGDFGLVVSNDGLHFREPVKGYVFLDRRESVPTVAADVRYEEILLEGNGILNVGGETRIYHGRWVNAEHDKDYYGEIALATLPRDRWGALGLYPHASEGSVWTAPIVLGKAGAKVSVNAQGVGGITVEAADERFHPIPEYSGENAGTVSVGDGLDCPVQWPRANLDLLTKRKIRLLIHLKKEGTAEPRLFALYIANG